MYLDARKKRQKRRRIVCLEWDGRSLRVAEATVSKKGVRLEKVFSVLLPSEVDVGDASSLGRFIRRVLDERGVSAKLAVVDVPRNQAILTTLMLPTGVPQELPGMVEFQIAKELPFPLSEAVVDFAVPHEVKEKTSPVLVAAVRNEVIEQFSAVMTAAGLKLERVGLRPFASRTAVTRMLGPNFPERVLFVDVGPTMTEIDVITSESVPFSRAADVPVPHEVAELRTFKIGDRSPLGDVIGDAGASPLMSLESVVESLVLEVTRSVEAYRARERGQRIAHAVIAGSMGVEEALQEVLQKRFDFTVELYNPATTFGWTSDEGAAATGYASVLGLVLSHDADPMHHFDFLHPKKPVTQAEVQLRRAPRIMGWAAAVALTAAAVYYTSVAGDLKRKASIQANIDALLEQKAEKEEFIKLVADLKAYDEQQPRWLDDFVALAMQLPDTREFVLGEVRMDAAERKLVIEARFPEKGREGWQIPFEVEEKLEAFRREGTSKARFEVDLGPTTKNTVNPKYPLKQQFSVFLLDDGLVVLPSSTRGGRAVSGDESSGKSATAASASGTKSGGNDQGRQDHPLRGDEPSDATSRSTATNVPTPSGSSRSSPSTGTPPRAASRPSSHGKVATPEEAGSGRPPVTGVKTDAQGRPLSPAGREGSSSGGAGGANSSERSDAAAPPAEKD